MDDSDKLCEGQVQGIEKPHGDSHTSEKCESVSDSQAMEVCDKSAKAEEDSLSGASSEPEEPLQGGAGGPGSSNIMAKMMMMMMTGGEKSVAPGSSGMPDLMSLLKEGGMPLPDMMSMMSKEGMSAMMSKGAMDGGIARLFDCIIDMSLASADSDESDDDEDGSTVELPCQYCCRFFSSQMRLKTHILVAHEHEDDSVLNLNQLSINSEGKRPNDRLLKSRKHSRDVEVFASGSDAKISGRNSGSRSVPSRIDLASAESVNVRGVKRGRTESRDSDAAETGGAAGVEDTPGEEMDHAHSSHALPDVFEACGSSDTQSQHTSMEESTSQFKHKKTRTRRFLPKSHADETDKLKDEDSGSMKTCAAVFKCPQEDSDSKKLKIKTKDSLSSPKDHSAAAAGPSEMAGDSPSSARRSLRSRKSHY